MKHIRFSSRLIRGICIMVLGSLAIMNRPSPSRWTGRSESPAILAPSVQQTASSEATAFTFRTHYRHCGHTIDKLESSQTTPDPVRLQLHYSDWEFQIRDDGLHFVRSFDQLCPSHLFIRREKGYLSLYQNKDGSSRLSRIALLPDPLHEGHDQALAGELDEGIVFDDTESLEQYLESLNS